MRAVFFGIYSKRPEYPRLANLLAGLRECGDEVVECRVSLAPTFESRFRSAASFLGTALFGFRLLWSYVGLTLRYLRLPPADVVLVGHPGFFHAHLARLLLRLRSHRALLVLDAFFSLSDSLVLDRQVLAPGSFFARLLRWIEAGACRTSDLCLTDTAAHADYLARELRVPRQRFRSVPVGPLFPPFPAPAPTRDDGSGLSLLFVGTYIPLQGVEVILAAAKLLSDEIDISFTLVGKGQLRRKMEEDARRWRLEKVAFRDWIPSSRLGEFLRSHDVALGIFGTTAKAQRVIPHKVYDACAAGVPLVTADSLAIREALCHGVSAYLVPPGDPAALVEAIVTLKSSPSLRRELARGALETARRTFSEERIGRELRQAFGWPLG